MVVTICASLKQKDDILYYKELFEVCGCTVLTPEFNVKNSSIGLLSEIHNFKISKSDIVLIISKSNNSIVMDNSVTNNYNYANSLKKKILFVSRIKEVLDNERNNSSK